MYKPPWKHLVDNLKDTEFESVYLDRLKSRVDAALDRPGLEKEILQEMASALGKAGEKVDLAFLSLQIIEKQLEATSDVTDKEELRQAFNRKREEAMRALRELIIHREALGFRDNQRLRKIYPIPPRR